MLKQHESINKITPLVNRFSDSNKWGFAFFKNVITF